MMKATITVTVVTETKTTKREWKLTEDEWLRRKSQILFDAGSVIDLQCNDCATHKGASHEV